jgi:hypothetical protein
MREVVSCCGWKEKKKRLVEQLERFGVDEFRNLMCFFLVNDRTLTCGALMVTVAGWPPPQG